MQTLETPDLISVLFVLPVVACDNVVDGDRPAATLHEPLALVEGPSRQSDVFTPECGEYGGGVGGGDCARIGTLKRKRSEDLLPDRLSGQERLPSLARDVEGLG